MPRPIRIEYVGAHYHVMGRGNEGKTIFSTPYQHELFLKTLTEASEAHGILIRAYVIMPNHYHLLLTTPEGNLSQAMAWLLTTFTVRYNRSHQRIGHIFQGRYKAQLVDEIDYARSLIPYIHLNPIRTRIKGKPTISQPPSKLEEFPWSSHPVYLGKKPAPEFLDLEWLAFWGKGPSAHSNYADAITALIRQKLLEDPWLQMEDGFILARGESLEKIRERLRQKSGLQEVRLKAKEDRKRRSEIVRKLCQSLSEENLKLWARARLGGEKKVNLARDFKLNSGAAVLNRIKLLEKKSQTDPLLSGQMAHLRSQI